MDRQQEDVLRQVQERDVRFIRLWFTDVSGTLKQVAIAPAELEGAFTDGIGFDGSAIEGLTRVYESDLVMKPDASTFQVLPWQESGENSARMFCDLYTTDGEPTRSDPRAVLRRAIERAERMGFSLHVHPEIEFYLFHSVNDETEEPTPIDSGSYFDYTTRPTAPYFRSEAIKILEKMGISVEFSHHEAGPGQNEIDLRVADALTMADNIVTLRVVIEKIAIAQGIHASFMPKPLIDHPGSGMHTHLSLFEGDRNAFYDPTGQFQLSETARHFIAGILHHATEISAITCQHVNSYKRLWSGDEAPAHIAWGKNNQSALIRVPSFSSKTGKSARIEYRALDTAANPYLAFAVLLNAGLSGIENELEAPEPADVDVRGLSARERSIMNIGSLPGSLSDAIKEMQQSDLCAQTLGEDAFDYFLRNKRHEWEQYRNQVTPFERRSFFKL